MSGPALAIVAAAAVVLVGLLAALVTWIFHPHTKPPCTIDCPPPQSPAAIRAAPGLLAEQHSFGSSDFGFRVDYPESWKLQRSSGEGALFETRYGQLEIVGMRSAPGAPALIQERIGKFNGPQLPDLAQVGPIHGAHVGSVEGQGELYSATFTPSSGAGRSLLLRIAVIVARKGPFSVVATAVVPYDQSSGKVLADDIDYAMTEFRWRGER
jgi:hypothetical protein